MDGVPHVTQPPVRPGETFIYEFCPKDAGTYWFHPHDRGSEQVERGLHGVLIVEDPTPPAYSRDVMWVVDQHRFHRVRFSNDSARLHPIHMHGTFFRLLAHNGMPVDEPFFRDTVLVHGRETVDLGLVPTDLGQWMVHCHILEHAESGMMTLVEVVAGTV